MSRIPLADGLETAFVRRSVSTVTWSGYSRVLHDWELLLSDIGDSDRESRAKSFLVRQMVQGFRRGAPVRDSRRPVSYDMLL